MKTIIWNIFVGILVIIAIISDVKMVANLEPPQPFKEYKTQYDIDNMTQENILIKEIKK